jgi:hypothetical protein
MLLALILTLGGPWAPHADAQTVPQDAAYWRTYATALKPNSAIAVRQNDGHTVRGKLIGTTPDDLVIHVRPLTFRRRLDQHIRFDAISRISKMHPIRDGFIGGAAAVGGLMLFFYLSF